MRTGVVYLMLSLAVGTSCILESQDSWNLHVSCVCRDGEELISLANVTQGVYLILQKKFLHFTFKSCVHLRLLLDQSALRLGSEDVHLSLVVRDVHHLHLMGGPLSERQPLSLSIRSENVSVVVTDVGAQFRVLKSLDGDRGMLFLNVSSSTKRSSNREELWVFEKKIHGFSRENVLILVRANGTSYKEFMGLHSWKEILGTAFGIFVIMVTLGSLGLVFIAVRIFKSSESNSPSGSRVSESFIRNLDINDLLSGIMCQSRKGEPSSSNVRSVIRKDVLRENNVATKKNLTQEVILKKRPASSDGIKSTSFFSSVL